MAVLPDFFFDRIVSVPSLGKLLSLIESKAASGGGNLRGYAQTEIRGGNATNLAFALASLSVKTSLYCIGNERTRAALSRHPPNLRLRIMPGQPGYTAALEFRYRGKPVNVMISDVGDCGSFDGQGLSQEDVLRLQTSDCIALVNWSSNEKGNELAQRIFSLSGRKSRLNFIDPADLAGTEHGIKALAKKIVRNGLVDVMSLNENEVRIMARVLCASKLPQNYLRPDLLKVSKALHDKLQVTLDVHTPIGSVSSSNHSQAWVDSYGEARGLVTGAGDVWDAGDIVGHLLNFEPYERLRFATACAYLYVRSMAHIPPTLNQVTKLVNRRR